MMAGIERYLGARAAFNPAYSEASQHWYFLMNLTDTAQVYGINKPGAWPAMLTDYPERVWQIHTAPKQNGLLFSRDRGSNEHHQLFWMDLNTMHVTPLTESPSAIHLFGAFSPDGISAAYTSTARNGRDYDVYVLPIAEPAQAARMLDCQGHWEVRGWTDRGELLLHEVLSNAHQALYRYHLETEHLERLTPVDEPAQYHHPYCIDDTVYMLTDYGRDFLGLAAIATPGEITYLKTPEADIDGLAVDRQGRTVAYAINREGFSELHLYDIQSGQDRHLPQFDQSVIAELAFDADGQHLAVTRSGPDHNLNISLVRVSDGTAEQLTFAPMAGLDVRSLVAPRVVRYPTFDGRDIPAYLYRPAGSGDLPVVVSVHGGPEAQERPHFNGLYQYLLAHGYAVIAPNVRGSTGYGKAYSHLDDREKRMDAVRDVASLVDWIRKTPGLDGHRIAIYGGSYGGFMVLSSITQYPDLFQSAVDIVGIANLETFLENTSEWRRALREAEYGYLATDREFLRKFSPIHAVDRIRTPLFVVHGANDPRVPLSEAEQIVAALKARQQPVQYKVYSDEGHGIAKMKNRLNLYPQLAEFLDRHLKETFN